MPDDKDVISCGIAVGNYMSGQNEIGDARKDTLRKVENRCNIEAKQIRNSDADIDNLDRQRDLLLSDLYANKAQIQGGD